MRVAVIGATGVLGRHLVPRLLEQGHAVVAIGRRDEPLRRLAAAGAEIFSGGDLLAPETLRAPLQGCDAVINLATAVPRPGERRALTQNDRLRREGVENLLALSAQLGIPRLLQQGIAWVTESSGEHWCDEDSACTPSFTSASAIDMEATLAPSALDWTVLRGGYLYGPGTGVELRWAQLARAGQLPLPEGAPPFVSLIHVADLARAYAAALTAPALPRCLAIVDDEPVRLDQLFDYVCTQLQGGLMRAAEAWRLPSFRVRNTRARTHLGWSPAYPSYRAGLADLVDRLAAGEGSASCGLQ